MQQDSLPEGGGWSRSSDCLPLHWPPPESICPPVRALLLQSMRLESMKRKKTQNLFCMYKNITRYKLWYITIAQRGLMAFFFHNEVQQKNGWRWTQLITFHKSCTQRYTQGIYTNQAQIFLLQFLLNGPNSVNLS